MRYFIAVSHFLVLCAASPLGFGQAAVGMIRTRDVIGLDQQLDQLKLKPTAGTGMVSSRAAVIDATGQLSSATGNMADCVRVDGSSGPCSSASVTAFVDRDIVVGAVDGTNKTFTISNDPQPVDSLKVYRNGLLLLSGEDYTYSAKVITFFQNTVPQSGDLLQVFYRTDMPPASKGIGFRDPGNSPPVMDKSYIAIGQNRGAFIGALTRSALNLSLHLHAGESNAAAGVISKPKDSATSRTPQIADVGEQSARSKAIELMENRVVAAQIQGREAGLSHSSAKTRAREFLTPSHKAASSDRGEPKKVSLDALKARSLSSEVPAPAVAPFASRLVEVGSATVGSSPEGVTDKEDEPKSLRLLRERSLSAAELHRNNPHSRAKRNETK